MDTGKSDDRFIYRLTTGQDRFILRVKEGGCPALYRAEKPGARLSNRQAPLDDSTGF